MAAELSRVTRAPFGRTRDGREVTRFTLLGAGGMTVDVLDYGAAIQRLVVPDRWGRPGDVVLGFDHVAGYEEDDFYLGVVVGRSAGRIRGGRFTLDGTEHQLTVNNGDHHLHGGRRGFGKALWRGSIVQDDSVAGVALEHTSPDGDEGYPGTLAVRVGYAVTPDNVLVVDYQATTDRPTPVNLTQHSYFNLAGAGRGDVLGHQLRVCADAFTPLGEDLVPTGAIAPVAGTPLDFRAPRPIGEAIGAAHDQLRIAGGYDQTFVLRRSGNGLSAAAVLADPVSGRVMEVSTTQPGMQLYSANFLDGSSVGKGGHHYGPRAGVCLEAQGFPDAPNQPAFPSTILRPGQELRARTEYRFSTGSPP